MKINARNRFHYHQFIVFKAGIVTNGLYELTEEMTRGMGHKVQQLGLECFLEVLKNASC